LPPCPVKKNLPVASHGFATNFSRNLAKKFFKILLCLDEETLHQIIIISEKTFWRIIHRQDGTKGAEKKNFNS
jgi:hypothetical protein